MHGGTLHAHIDGHLGGDLRHLLDVAAGSELERAVTARRVVTTSLPCPVTTAPGNCDGSGLPQGCSHTRGLRPAARCVGRYIGYALYAFK